ncbi:hypothetical protein L596_028828 [Steinernema carpocapsae]|uniref:Uncharacterized protein n=1 Tax=Steinernema carpocapsae TaxID=34508 RepID=A0A4U5LZI6_STECR|nr:hypothetical protein L596_028828 [Steinernema carpocapsae]
MYHQLDFYLSAFSQHKQLFIFINLVVAFHNPSLHLRSDANKRFINTSPVIKLTVYTIVNFLSSLIP